ncbi:MAG: GPR endopeptidase [Clostridia bacterium]|nr:GPR endopeptidase [Clostridia bacterium]
MNIGDVSYAHTDLALESVGESGGTDLSEETRGGCVISRLFIRGKKGEEMYGKPRGRYVTVSCGRMWEFDDERADEVSDVLAAELRRMTRDICGRALDRDFGVLVAGLGNDEITADAIGPGTVRRLEVTRHLRTYLPDAYEQIGVCAISALSPGVLGQTGIETVELVRGAAENAKPDIIIAIDALAARSVTRLASTVQLSDNGINPGSGIGNNRRAICRDTVGVPVLALGVPTVVDSATLVYDALSRAGVGKVSRELREVLEEGREFFVSPKESDVIAKKVSALLARAIGQAFTLK